MSDVLDSLHPTLRELPGKTIVDRYRIDEALGVGGMGAVFRGRHLGLKRDVAIKVLHPELTRDPEISKRFDREAHSASRLDHPNCLRVTDVGTTDDGVKFMVMDLLSGSELADRLGKPLPPDRAVLMALQIVRGLEHAHDNGVVHRDVKPENIFITRDHEGREVLKLVDFGIAKLAGGGGGNDTRMTRAGLIFGTPAYMSPEQAMGVEADARADLYAVGVILYEMLTGEPPFESDDPVKLVRMQVSRDPPPLPDTVPSSLAAIVMKLLAKDRDDRFQTATEVKEHLELVLQTLSSSGIVGGTTLHGARVSSIQNTAGVGLVVIQPPTGPIPLMATGHSTTGPFPIMTATSSGMQHPLTGPIPMMGSNLMTLSGEGSSGAFSPAALPTLPPGSTVLQPHSRNRPLVLGAVASVVLAVGLWAIFKGDDEPTTAVGAVAVAQGADGAGEGSPSAQEGGGDDGDLVVEDGPDDQRLAEIDRLIFADKVTEAQALLKPLLDEYKNNAMLEWRQGRIYAKGKKTKSKALAAYGNAVDANPSLLEDNDFYAELHALLINPKLRNEALDFALRKMGRAGHKFLLELVNEERNPLVYNDRHRALQELSTVDANDPLVNWQLHRALDLLQASEQAITPCTAYREALDSIATTPDYWYYPRVQKASLPTPKTGEGLTAEETADAAQCEGIDARRAEVLAELEKLAPVEATDTGDDEVVMDDPTGGEADATPAKTTSKSTSSGKSKGKSKSTKSGCNRPFGFMNKKC